MMAFSCYFDFEAKEKSEWRVWKMKAVDNLDWCIEEKWTTPNDISPVWERHLEQPEETCWHEISLKSLRGRKYFAELEFLDKENPHHFEALIKQQVLCSGSVIDIALGEYVNHFSQHRYTPPILLRCNINLFPLFHPKPMDPIPLQPLDVAVRTVKLDPEKIARELLSDMKSLSESGYFSDVVLYCDSVEIKAHKSILYARSPVFATLLEDAKARNECKLTISNVSADILEKILSYIYTGEAEMTNASTVRHLYVAADMYALPELKAMCLSFLKSLMTDLQPVLDNYALADSYDDHELKKIAVDFLSKHYYKIRTDEPWKYFMNLYPHLALDVLQYVLEHKLY